MDDPRHSEVLEQTAEIISAYVSGNHVSREDLVKLIGDVFTTLSAVGKEPVQAAVSDQPLTPAVSIRKSVTPDYLICLEDGKPFKSLRRHLQTKFGLSPEEYRAKWGLPSDYPMVAANYAARRSELAKSIGLGRKIES
ncbi:Ros/MucR family transcriptional regulator [Aureimonas ureilytica]|uniref:MucR family transcriptional regulator n=1 Tax=Aureimonas ureilytica TaxID=401562 RepID=UPI0009DC42FD|nr:MucR family transcriptional regulator [Aureimonas ureilytica]